MKPVVKYLMLTLLVFAVAGVSAQQLNEDTTTHQPFFKASKFSSRCYVGLEASVVQVLKTRVGSNFGVDLNWVINHKYVISAIYDGLATQNQIQKIVIPADPSTPLYLTHRYVGGGFSYILFSDKMFSLQPGISDGWGHIQYSYNNVTYRKDFYELVPAVTATYNCTKYFRVGLGLNYRITAGAKLNGLGNTDINGVGGIIFIKVGTF
jgi:hypothetical protein